MPWPTPGIVQGIGGSRLALGASITRGSVVTLLDNAVAEYADQDGALRHPATWTASCWWPPTV